MRDRILIAGLVFMLLAPPVLCMGGVLQHECRTACCDCDEACNTGAGQHEGCGHESKCASDPCKTLIRSSARQIESADDLFQMSQWSILSAAMDNVGTRSLNSLDCFSADHSGASPPAAPLVLPLLI